ncbi:molecular chaperone DnaJ [Patescibacteria group bacterium]|nr:molecular chaperone DnaJ [Patescibacteria group bacterium]
MPANKDFYQTLGVKKDASDSDIKSSYRKLAHKYHPDKGGSKEDEAKFKEVQEAYEVLSDKQKRAQYDQFGAAGVNQGATSGPGQGQPGAGFGGFEGFQGDFSDMGGLGDIFEQFFAGGANTRQRQPSRGADIQASVSISFEEAVKGAKRQLKVTKRVLCPTCHGNGAEPGSKIVTCDTCGGSGQVQTTRQTILGTMAQVTTCPVCHGEGKKPEKPCHTCGGEGRVEKTETVDIDIPAGIDDGQTIRVQGAGEAGQRGAPAGHLYVTVQVKPSEVFERNGADAQVTVPITYPQAALGDTIEVPTLDGKTTLKIPAGTESGKVFGLKGKGLPKLQGSGHGNLHVKVEINVPKKLSAAERQKIEELAKTQGKDIKAKKSLFNKLGL